MPFRLITFILLSYIAIHDVCGTAIDLLYLDNTTCPYQIRHLGQYDNIQVEWDGRQLPPYCRLSFIGRSLYDNLDRYEICVEAWKYDIDKCDFTMKYFSTRGYSSYQPTKEYSCYDELPPKFCAEEDKYLDIEFEAGSSSTSSLTLFLTATRTYSDADHSIMVYVGISVVVVVCMVVLGVVLCLLYRRRNQQPSQGMILQQTTPAMQNPIICAGSTPLNQPYVQTGQGIYPAPSATVQHPPLLPPPMYSELSTVETKLPLSDSDMHGHT